MENNNKHLTFGDLNYLSDKWISEISDYENTFYNQLEYVKNLVKNVSESRGNIENLNTRLNIAKYIQNTIDNNLKFIEDNEKRMEEMITNLERNDNICCCNHDFSCPTDATRENIYETAEKVFVTLENYREVLDKLEVTATENYKPNLENPFQSVVQLLATDLNLLQDIENKLLQLKNCLENTCCLKYQVLRKLHENGVTLTN